MRRVFFYGWLVIESFLLNALASTAAINASDEIYFPPTAALPEILAEFGGGQVSADDFRLMLRLRFQRGELVSDTVILHAALEDMADFSERTGVIQPLDAKFHGWDNEIVMTVNERDFTWQESVDLYIERVATATELTLALGGMIDQAIIRAEAARILERDLTTATDAVTALREALSPLFTPEALEAFYLADKEKFLVLKIRIDDEYGERTIYAAVAPTYARMVPITEYGVDYLATPNGLQSPLVALPEKVIGILSADDELFDDDIHYRVLARIYPRNATRLRPLLASIRLESEITRLLAAVRGQNLKIHWQPQAR